MHEQTHIRTYHIARHAQASNHARRTHGKRKERHGHKGEIHEEKKRIKRNVRSNDLRGKSKNQQIGWASVYEVCVTRKMKENGGERNRIDLCTWL